MRIIAIGAHLDDIELACGGTIAKMISKGHEVMMIVLSKSDYTHYSGTYGRASEIAIEEGRCASAMLGVNELKVFDFPTKDVPNDSAVVEVLNKELDEYQPSIIFTHWQFDTHKSHANTALSTFAAARYFNTILMYEPFPPAGRSYVAFRPQLYVDITKTITSKLDALSQHKSELSKYGPEWIKTVEARARLRGFEMMSSQKNGERYAEVFEVLRIGTDIF